ncbi:MAG: beta-lactamase [Candidatus Eisenbacteria bacterium]|uniref:Beta-lactamase n=1 Tax=Eiseniibacteriota bacterium TaxID=2212470 RepID=A0A933SCY2_UNCEI|nr:beta-lactamase [Candidatus Eisenbacteria bacterium]
MKKPIGTALLALVLAASVVLPVIANAGTAKPGLSQIVRDAVVPIMRARGIPGVSIAVTSAGKSQVFHFGVSSRETRAALNDRTLFEVGSVSKTFTATLASWAEVQGKLAWSDSVSRHLPALQGTAFGDLRLVHLATHTPGGLPLQVPEDVTDEAQLLQWFARWTPEYPPGTRRTYGNPGIGALGLAAAHSLGGEFATLVQREMLPALGMTNTFLEVPEARLGDYAQGYDSEDSLARMTPGVIGAEAYGIRTTAADLVRWVQANMGDLSIDRAWQRAITATHTGYFTTGRMTQDLVWEQYAYPVPVEKLLAGNSRRMIFEPNPAIELVPPMRPRDDVWINKTGSTRGFSAYVAFVPKRHIGVVVLANKSIPIEDRIAIAYRIMQALDGPVR